MRLCNIQQFLHGQRIAFHYEEEDECGSLEFEYRGLRYHIWEYPPPERGAASNIRNAGRSEEYEGEYEKELLDILRSWEGIE